ncbi:hypothetical protein [uncultured Maribacter sp.]|uniref:hypothetical protein n=1 Tax=uncultured Maribacter sp. TaxID=431308 RepID=UPI0026272AD2|nr:hypothetical protein [uncultured Maribacter sp.]
MKKIAVIGIGLFSILIIMSCGGSKNETNEAESAIKPPESSVLIFPFKDEICTTGEFISDTESDVEFEWNSSENTDSYEVILKDLSTNNEATIATSNTKIKITLKQNNPYTWKVISKSNKTNDNAISEEWRLYNASQGIKNYAPFPATLVHPEDENTIIGKSTNLEWQGIDVDGFEDIELYDILLGTENPPTTLLNTTTESEIASGTLSSGTYYWRITTTDKSGNKTTSQINSFIVN